MEVKDVSFDLKYITIYGSANPLLILFSCRIAFLEKGISHTMIGIS